MHERTRRRRAAALGVLAWGLAVTAGMTSLWRYATSPEAPAEKAARWPATSELRAGSRRPTLILFAHPHCPCTRATLGELARLMAQARGRLEAYVLFLSPESLPEAWARTELWRDAQAIPAVRVVADRNGDEARRFGATGSGTALLYAADGRLVFGGGITAARGHSGDNAGRDAIVTFLDSGAVPNATTRVYGCALFGEDGRCTGKEIVKCGRHS